MSYKGKKVAVVVPCHNEELLIQRVIDTMPPFVDKIVIVDDVSSDRTVERVNERVKANPEKIILIRHETNQGVGGAIATGYIWARDNNIELTAVMAGDGQMDPDELMKILDPVADDIADYSKGNRFFAANVWEVMPKYRFFGNAALTLMTKIASGYWHTVDTQSGYTAISLEALKTLDLSRIFKRYGVPNDILVKLNVFNFRVVDVPIKPIYGIGEKSGIRVRKVLFSMSWLLVKLFFHRMWNKYVLRDFHPLLFFYFLSAICLPAGFAVSVAVVVKNFPWSGAVAVDPLPIGWIVLGALLLIAGFQFLLFAMWFDMEHNRNLCVFMKHGKNIYDPVSSSPGRNDKK